MLNIYLNTKTIARLSTLFFFISSTFIVDAQKPSTRIIPTFSQSSVNVLVALAHIKLNENPSADLTKADMPSK